MVAAYNRKDLESFVKGIIDINKIIEEEKPDIVIAPMMGAVPIIDAINAVNPYFDNSRVYYVPASSSLHGLNNILPVTLSNVLSDVVDELPAHGLKIMSIDEVVSGSSATRLRNKADLGIQRYISIKKLGSTEQKQIRYLQIGLEHGAFIESGKQWNNGYTRLKESGLLIPVRVNRIITMDNPEFCPARYKPKPNDPARNTPTLQGEFVISRVYVQLLAEIASIAGTDPDLAVPKNLSRIFEHQKYVPKKYMLQ